MMNTLISYLKCCNMKKVMLLSVLTLFLIRIANAQHGRQKNNYLDINAGIGLLPAFVKDAGKAKTLPLSLSADYKLAKHFSLGAFAGYSVTETSLKALPAGGRARWQNRFSLAGLRLAARSSALGPWNIYGGMSLAYAHSRVRMLEGQLEKAREEKGIQESSGRLLYSGFLGGRYSFTPRIGMFGELGFGASLVSLGMSVRI